MFLERWDPFRDYRRVGRLFDHIGLGDRYWRGIGPTVHYGDFDSWAIPLDIVRDGDEVLVHASVPGVKPEDISVAIEDDVLTITGKSESESEDEEGTYLRRERRTGSFRRSLRLPDSVDAEHAHSSYANGVVTITLPKAEDKKARRLTLEVKDGGKALSEAA